MKDTRHRVRQTSSVLLTRGIVKTCKMTALDKHDTVITFGTYDLLHVGHIRLLKRARAMGKRLVVGVSSDALNLAKKGRAPVYSLPERIEMLQELRCVDKVFVEESLEAKRDYVLREGATLLVMGDDWAGRFDNELADVCTVLCIPRTECISTTATIERIKTK